MPLYRYQCKGCGEEFTRLVFLGKENELKCVKCGSSELKRLFPGSIGGGAKKGRVPFKKREKGRAQEKLDAILKKPWDPNAPGKIITDKKKQFRKRWV